MKSRAVIEQAKGMLMAARRCDEDEAFDVLVRASQRENVKLRDIAARIVARAQQPASGDGDGHGDGHGDGADPTKPPSASRL